MFDGFVEPVAYFPAILNIDGLCVKLNIRIGLFDIGYGCVESFLSDVCDGDGGAAGGEELGGCKGDAGGRASDGDDSAFERGHDKALDCKH